MKRNHPIQFDYCECGCKCVTATSKGISYTIYMDLEKRMNTLYQGHGRYGTPLTTSSNYKEVITFAQDHFDKIP